MLVTVLGALVPIVFVIALGFFAGRRHAFPADGITVLTRLALDFAVPAALFASTVTVPRETLIAQLPLVLAFVAAVTLGWFATYGISRYALRHDAVSASIQALLVAFPAVPFFGIAVLSDLYGGAGAAAASIGSIVVNLVPVPLSTVVIARAAAAPATGGPAAPAGSLGPVLLGTFTTPYIVAPVAAVLLVAAGLHVPAVVLGSVRMIGDASSGVGLFVAGMTLAGIRLRITGETIGNTVAKLIILPAIFLACAHLLAVTGPEALQGLILASLPSGALAVLLATKHRCYQAEASATMALDTLALAAVLPILLLVFGEGSS